MTQFAHNMYYVNLCEDESNFILFSFNISGILRNFAENTFITAKWTTK